MSLHRILSLAAVVILLGASVACSTGVLPPTRNYLDPDPELDLDYIPNEPREKQVEIAVSSNFAFGGQNACLVITAEPA